MGFKVAKEVNPIAVQITDGVLAAVVGTKVITINVPMLEGYDFPEQCNMFLGNMTEDIRAYLINKKTGKAVVLRFDGTGTLYQLKSKILIKSFTFDNPRIMYEEYTGGILATPKLDLTSGVIRLFGIDDGYYILSCNAPISMVLNRKENPLYFKDLSARVPGYPLLKEQGDNIIARTRTNEIYHLVGTVYSSEGFSIL